MDRSASDVLRRSATGGEHQKVFHQLKSKMEERKSWASSPVAKAGHALFECLAHNLQRREEAVPALERPTPLREPARRGKRNA